MTPSVTVIVIHRDQPAQLARTLLGLRRQTHPADQLEIIVVDDHSLSQPDVGNGVRLLRPPGSGGDRSLARNTGVAASHGELLCFLDADTTPEPKYVAELIRPLAAAPDLVTVGERRHADFTGVPVHAEVGRAGPTHALPGPGWLQDGYRDSDDLRRPHPGNFRFVISAVLAVSHRFFDEVGGFDESFDRYGGEDWEWAHRAWLAGAEFRHVPSAIAWHDGPDWSARRAGDPDRARREKNAEARRLAPLINVAGHRSHGLLNRRPTVVATLPADLDIDARFITADSLLAALPGARIVTDDLTALPADPRLMSAAPGLEVNATPSLFLDVLCGIRCDPAGLAAFCERAIAEDLPLCRLVDAGGPMVVAESARHRARRAHRGAGSDDRDAVDLPAPWLNRLGIAPDVEAYLGGWDR